MTDVVEELTPHTARQHLVEGLTAKGFITRPEVAAAFLAVPRHEFVPAGTSLQAAYADDVVITKKSADGRATSSVSAPWLSLSTLIVLRCPWAKVGHVHLDVTRVCCTDRSCGMGRSRGGQLASGV